MFVLRTHERNNPDFRKYAKVNSGLQDAQKWLSQPTEGGAGYRFHVT